MSDVDPIFKLTREVQKHAQERGPDALAFCKRELAATEQLSERVQMAFRLSRVSAGLLLSSGELERVLLGLASYHNDLEAAVRDLEKARPRDPTLEACGLCGTSVGDCNRNGGECCPDCTHR